MSEKKKVTPSVKKTTKSTSVNEQIISAQAETILPQKTKKRKQIYLLAILIVVLLGLLLYYFRGYIVVAMVNGQPISRIAYVNEMEKVAGSRAMNTLITKTLIMQEAQKKGINIGQSEIDEEKKKIEQQLVQQGQKLDAVLAMKGITLTDLEDQIKTQLIVEKLLANQVKVTDKEIAAYKEQNKDVIKDMPDSAIKNQLMQERLTTAFSTYIQKLQKDAKINYFIPYTPQQ